MIRLETKQITVTVGSTLVLRNVSATFPRNTTTALIGPAGAGKSVFLQLFNRLTDLIPDAQVEGQVFLDGTDVFSADYDVYALRRKAAFLFPKPTLFPGTIFDNVAFGLRIARPSPVPLMETVERALYQTGVWDEVKDVLYKRNPRLSPLQKQLICLARGLAPEPSVLLLDDATVTFDPISVSRFEEALDALKKDYTILFATHSHRQAGRISERTAFFQQGELLEIDTTRRVFTHPTNPATLNFITGRYET